MTDRVDSSLSQATRWALVSLCVVVMAGCATDGGHDCARHVESFGGTLVMQPGWTGLCRAPPCEVRFVMPAGSGDYEVLADQQSLGRFPAGQTVTLGEFSRGRVFTVVDTGLRPSRLYVQ